MTIKKSLLGGLKLSGLDAAKFLEQMAAGPTSRAAASGVARGRVLLEKVLYQQHQRQRPPKLM